MAGLFHALSAKASHLVGGDIAVKHLGNGYSKFTLTMYFDDINGLPSARDPYVTISVFDKSSNANLGSVNLPMASDSTLSPTVPACLNVKLKTDIIQYTSEVYFPASIYHSAEGYYVSWERCCRNTGVTNLANSDNLGMTLYTEFPSPALYPNGVTPVFNKPKADFGCLGKLFSFSVGATDTNGDSLVFAIATPIMGNSNTANTNPVGTPGPYPLASWLNGFSTANPFGSSTPVTLSDKGLLSFTPTQIGLFVFAVECTAFHNGVRVSLVHHEYQLLVTTCPDNPGVTVQLYSGAGLDTLYKQHPADTIFIDGRYKYAIGFKATHPWQGTAITVTSSPIGFTGTIQVNNATDTTTTPFDTVRGEIIIPACITPSNTTLAIRVIAGDNACTFPKSDTVYFYFKSVLPETFKPDLYAALNPQPYILYVDSVLQFPVFGKAIQPDDSLSLYLVNDSLPDGFTFHDVNGIGNVQSLFYWKPSCSNLPEKNYRLTFVLSTLSCGGSLDSIYYVEVIFRDNPIFYPDKIANVFTPNGDGVNDVFTIPGLPPNHCFDQFEKVEIYNRWGEKVYQSSDRLFAWDGHDITDGIYFYEVFYNNRRFKGWVQCLK